jgi:hypothetical protein
MSDNLKFISPRIISLAEESKGSDIYMTVELVLLDTLVNLNGIQYSKEFLQEIADNKDNYITIPLMAEVNKINQGKTDNLTHAYNKKTGKFTSQMIGSFFDFYTQESPNNKEVLELVGKARIPKRFETVCEVLQALFDEGSLQFSYEIAAGEYKSIDGVKYVDKSDKNFLFAMAVVSSPAVVSAKALTLVAAIENDFNLIEGGEGVNMQRNKENFTEEMMFANTKVHITELAELDMSQIRKKIYKALKELFKDDYWNWDIADQYPGYFILQNYQDGDYYKMTYTVSDTDITLSEKVKVTKNYQEIGGDPEMATIKELELEVANLKLEIASKDTTIKEKENLIAEKDTVISTKDTELAEVNTKVTTLSETVLTNQTELAELKEVKEKYDVIVAEQAKVELAEKKANLKAKYSNLLDEKVMAEVEIAEAVENLNEDVLKNKVVEIAMASATQAKPSIITASRITDNVSIGKNDLVSKYITVRE